MGGRVVGHEIAQIKTKSFHLIKEFTGHSTFYCGATVYM